MTRRLQPEDRISKYRIVGLLGAGGMGEVYLAQDQVLERNVALKVLPADLVRNEERVRRFVQEAKSASSLNHPNIVTIYEIGSDVLRGPGSEEPVTGTLHFISMELVSGKTLSALIHDEKTDLRTLLGYMAQAAEGLAKAHAAGIVHRDLKPGNIMVSTDGFAKIVDFGLAKLIEKREPGATVTHAPTVHQDATQEGVVLGTAAYMAPEQVQGKPVDHRADIFAFGSMLYEAATRQQPFQAESSVETMHRILHDKPEPIETANPEVPAELRRLIRRALTKNPEQRLQSMKDLALELREIVDDFESLSASATSGSATRILPGPSIARRRWHPIWFGLAALVLVAAVAGIWKLDRDGGKANASALFLRAISMTSRGNVNECVLSKDGRYLGYLTGASGISAIHVLQVVTGTDVEIASTSNERIEGLTFSPDGNYLYYLSWKNDTPNYRALMQIPSLGGEPRQRAFDVDSRVSFSPDGKQIVFRRGRPQENKDELVIHDLEGSSDRVVASVSAPTSYTSVTWSPDGKRLAAVQFGPTPAGISSSIELIDVAGGRRQVIRQQRGARFQWNDWLPDGSGIVVAGEDIALSVASQLQLISSSGANKRALTNDLSNYEGVSVAADGSIASTREIKLGNLWVMDMVDEKLRQLTSISNPDWAPYELVMADNDHAHYVGLREQEFYIFSIPLAGGDARILTPSGGILTRVLGYDGGLIFVRIDRKELQAHIWKMDADGNNLRQLTHGPGEAAVDVTRDGQRLLYTRVDTLGYWLVSTEGNGEPRLLGNDARFRWGGGFSPDGHNLIAADLSPTGNLVESRAHVFSADDGRLLISLPHDPNIFRPEGIDDESFSYLNRGDPNWNLYKYSMTGTKEAISAFTEGRLREYAWSPDRNRIAVVLRKGDNENVWLLDRDGSHPRQITTFGSETIMNLGWSPDSHRLIIHAGQASRDAVLLKSSEPS